VMMD